MILSFKKRFVDKILSGTKIHTIREDKPGRWKAGNRIHMATGVRTPNYDQFNKNRDDLLECKLVQKIEFFRYLKDQMFVKINGSPLSFEMLKILAKNDGFDSWKDMFEWFVPIDGSKPIEKQENYWKGKIIHWTNFKYINL